MTESLFEIPTGATKCRCGAWWQGMNTAHCTMCHLTYSGITAWEKHVVRDYRKPAGQEVHCVHPKTVGLVLADRTYECWTVDDGKSLDEAGE